MNFETFLSKLEEIAIPRSSCSWDKSCLFVGTSRTSVSRVLIALDLTPYILDEAIQLGVDCVVVHHPLTLGDIVLSSASAFEFLAIKQLLSHDIALYVAHTSLDANIYAASGFLADLFSLRDRKPLQITLHKHAVSDAIYAQGDLGIGCIGTCEITSKDLLSKLKDIAHPFPIAYCGVLPETIHTLAYCTGAGSSLIPTAYQQGADVYITGEIKHNFAVNPPLPLIEVGHFSLEYHMMLRFSSLLQDALQGDVHIHTAQQTSPFTFI